MFQHVKLSAPKKTSILTRSFSRAVAKEPLQFNFPPVEELLEKAEKCTESCYLIEQVDVSRDFFRNVAYRGARQRKYSMEDVKRAHLLIDYMASTKLKELNAVQNRVQNA